MKRTLHRKASLARTDPSHLAAHLEDAQRISNSWFMHRRPRHMKSFCHEVARCRNGNAHLSRPGMLCNRLGSAGHSDAALRGTCCTKTSSNQPLQIERQGKQLALAAAGSVGFCLGVDVPRARCERVAVCLLLFGVISSQGAIKHKSATAAALKLHVAARFGRRPGPPSRCGRFAFGRQPAQPA